MQYGLKPGAFTFTVDRKLEGGETLTLGGMTWEVIPHPRPFHGGNRPL